jgi:PAS domain S-box-containing protein
LSYGYKKEDIIGKCILKFVTEKYWPVISQHLKDLAEGKSTRGELELITLKGTKIAEFSCSPIKRKGKVVGFQSILRETQQRQMRQKLGESEEKHSLIFQNSPDGIITLDTVGNVTFVNDVILRYGYKREELVGKNILELSQFVPEKSRELVSKHFADLKSGNFAHGEIEFGTPKGRLTIWFSAAPIKDGKEIVGFVIFVLDITDSKNMEARLCESEERLRQLIEYAPDAIYVSDLEGNFIDENREAEKVTGYKREELVGKNMFRLRLFSEKYLSKAMEALEKNACGQKTGPDEFEFVRKDRSTITLEISSYPVKSHGKVEIVAIARDIAERKAMKEELRESEERFRDLYEGIRDPISIFVGREGRLIDYNKAFKRLLGYADEELKDKGFLDFVHPDDRALVLEKYRTTYSEEELPLIYEVRGLNKKGETIPLEITVSAYKKKDRVMGIEVILRDITQRKRMEEELRESEERFRDLYEGIHDPVAIYVGKEGHLIDYNSAYKKLSGFTDEELKDKTFLDLTHPDDRAKVLEKYGTDYPEDKFPIVFEVRGINKNGGTNYLEASVSPYKRKGKVIGVEVINRDITERKRMEEEVRESEQKLRDLYESIPDCVAVYVGKEGRLLECNKAFKKHYGYTDEELKDKGFLDFIAPEDQAMLLREYRTDYPEEKLPFKFEIKAINKKGEIFPIEISVGPYKKKGKIIGINVVHRDITERKAMESKLQEYAEHLEEMVEERTKELKESQERLVKSERLAAIGQLAAMVGHDLRNPLTGIKGAAYYLKTKLSSKIDGIAREMLEVIEKDVEYSDKIIGDLLEYSREIKLELTETTPKSILKDILGLITVPESVQILELTESEPEIKIDNNKIKRVFINIIKNAIDAMSEGGILTIKSRESNGNLEISFADTGVGMSRETIEKLWTPLFTTKAKGIGLGLPICKRIVEAHGGKISVETAIGKGTTFTIAIPVNPKTESSEKLWVDVPKPLWSQTTKTQ